MGSRGTPLRVTIDASIFLSVCLNEDESVASAFFGLFERAGTRVVQPAIWLCQVVSGLRTANRRGALREEQSRRALLDLSALPIDFEQGFHIDAAAGLFETAIAHDLSAYDAAYIHFCLQAKSALWTLDSRLRGAAETAGVRTGR